MSILPIFPEYPNKHISANVKCFFCGEKVEDLYYIQWIGQTGAIELHVDCAAELAVNLMIDVDSVQGATNVAVETESGSGASWIRK